jgi:hypothetical protein
LQDIKLEAVTLVMQDRVTNNRTCSSDYLQNDDSGDDLLIDLELSQAQIDELNAILDSEDEEYEEGYVALPDMQDYDGEHSDEVDELLNVGAPSVREIAFVEMPQSLVYLAKRQHSDVAYTPVNGKAEVQLFKTLMLQLMSESRSVKSIQTFDHMRDEWNDIRKKYTEHLTSYFKKWSKNQARNEALKEAKASIILEGLEYTPVTHAGLETRTLENLGGRMIEQSEGVENASNSPDGTHHPHEFGQYELYVTSVITPVGRTSAQHEFCLPLRDVQRLRCTYQRKSTAPVLLHFYDNK